eukprot:scaffold30714_cov39-Attheya_sp.AAC.1
MPIVCRCSGTQYSVLGYELYARSVSVIWIHCVTKGVIVDVILTQKHVAACRAKRPRSSFGLNVGLETKNVELSFKNDVIFRVGTRSSGLWQHVLN